jgi:hypothetical protein
MEVSQTVFYAAPGRKGPNTSTNKKSCNQQEADYDQTPVHDFASALTALFQQFCGKLFKEVSI